MSKAKTSKVYKRKRRIKAAISSLLAGTVNTHSLTFGAFGGRWKETREAKQ